MTKGASLSIDTFPAAGAALGAGQGVDYLNDIHGFADPALYPDLAAAEAKLIVMHVVQSAGHRHPRRCPAGGDFRPHPGFFRTAAGGADRGGHRAASG